MDRFSALARAIAAPFARLSFMVLLLWLGMLRFVDPDAVVKLLKDCFPALACREVVYLLGAVEVCAGGMVFFTYAVRYVGAVLLCIYSASLAILFLAPELSYSAQGFPFLSEAGRLLLKNLMLVAASLTLVGAQVKPGEDFT